MASERGPEHKEEHIRVYKELTDEKHLSSGNFRDNTDLYKEINEPLLGIFQDKLGEHIEKLKAKGKLSDEDVRKIYVHLNAVHGAQTKFGLFDARTAKILMGLKDLQLPESENSDVLKELFSMIVANKHATVFNPDLAESGRVKSLDERMTQTGWVDPSDLKPDLKPTKELAKRILEKGTLDEIASTIGRVRSILTFDAAMTGEPIKVPNELMEQAYQVSFKLLEQLKQKFSGKANKSK
jgi:hypothetical protein